MKPSPTLEDVARLKEYCAWILRSASETAPASCVARAYLALISAQPGGEGVTLDTIARTIWGHMFPEHPPEHWWNEDEYIRGKYLECAKVVSSLLPAGMDRNATIEECAAVVDRG